MFSPVPLKAGQGAEMTHLEQVLTTLAEDDPDISEIIDFIRAAFPTYEQALGAMGYRPIEGPHAEDTSHIRLRVDPVTTALVK